MSIDRVYLFLMQNIIPFKFNWSILLLNTQFQYIVVFCDALCFYTKNMEKVQVLVKDENLILLIAMPTITCVFMGHVCSESISVCVCVCFGIPTVLFFS